MKELGELSTEELETLKDEIIAECGEDCTLKDIEEYCISHGYRESPSIGITAGYTVMDFVNDIF